MISKLSERAVEDLFADNEISESDRELYSYGFFMLFSHLFFLALTIFCGFLFGIILESIVFHVIFTVLRGYAGGVHASTEKICTLSTSLSLLFCVALIKILDDLRLTIISTIMLFLGAIIIIIFSPLDSPEKPLTKSEKKFYKKKTLLFCSLFIFVAIIALYNGLQNIYSCCSVAMCFESILLIVGVIKAIKLHR